MTNFDIYTIENYLINKFQTGNAYTPSEFATSLNHASLKLFKQRLGLPEQYSLDASYTQQGYASTTRMLVDLSDFLVIMDGGLYPSMEFVSGEATVPTDMAYPIGMTYNKPVKVGCAYELDFNNVELLDEGEYALRKGSFLKPISFDYPVYRIVAGKVKIVPIDIKKADFTYLKYPTDAVFATTTNVTTGVLEYNAAGSTELEWNDLAKLDIISIMLGDVGLNLRSQEVAQYAQAIKQQGV